MKTKLFIMLILLFSSIECVAQNGRYNYDSIRVVGFQYYMFRAFALQRSAFFEAMKYEREHSDNYVDTTIYNRDDIIEIVESINKLKPIKKLNVSTSKVDYIISQDGQKVEINHLDNQLCLILYKRRQEELIWVSENMLDKGFFRYQLGSEVEQVLSKYTSIFKYIYVKKDNTLPKFNWPKN